LSLELFIDFRLACVKVFATTIQSKAEDKHTVLGYIFTRTHTYTPTTPHHETDERAHARTHTHTHRST